MNSLDRNINSLHDAYCCAMNVELPMTMAFERWWRDAAANGLTPDGVTICIEQRLKFNRASTCKKGLMIHHLVRTDDDVAVVLNEIAVFKASQRIRVVDPAKASVLAATGRPATVPETQAKRVGDLKLLKQLKRAAQ